jgi:hypothetical protein
MKQRHLSLLAGLLIIGIPGASGSTTAAGINNTISSAHNANIGRIADQYAIARIIDGITIAITKIHDDANIQENEIKTEIGDISA